MPASEAALLSTHRVKLEKSLEISRGVLTVGDVGCNPPLRLAHEMGKDVGVEQNGLRGYVTRSR
jgi:hypothetical protein